MNILALGVFNKLIDRIKYLPQNIIHLTSGKLHRKISYLFDCCIRVLIHLLPYCRCDRVTGAAFKCNSATITDRPAHTAAVTLRFIYTAFLFVIQMVNRFQWTDIFTRAAPVTKRGIYFSHVFRPEHRLHIQPVRVPHGHTTVQIAVTHGSDKWRHKGPYRVDQTLLVERLDRFHSRV
jgi:hypothetical protein